MTRPMDDQRQRIDDLDRKIIALLEERAQTAVDLNRRKQSEGLPTYVPAREEQIFGAVRAHAGTFPKEAMTSVFSEIVSACRNLVHVDRIGVVGEKFGWSHDAALFQFGSSAQFTTMDHGEELLGALEKGTVSLGFFPLLDVAGDLSLFLEAFLAGKIHLVAETRYQYRFSLVTGQTGESPEFTELFATRETLGLLRNWVVSLSFPVRINVCRSVQEVAENMVETASAVGLMPEGVAKTLGIRQLQSGIEPLNTWPKRCVAIARQVNPTVSAGMKGSFLCSLLDEPGSLVRVLAPFQEHQTNILGVEMFPFQGKPWKELFLVDFVVKGDADWLKTLLQQVEPRCQLFSFLGTYPVVR